MEPLGGIQYFWEGENFCLSIVLNIAQQKQQCFNNAVQVHYFKYGCYRVQEFGALEVAPNSIKAH